MYELSKSQKWNPDTLYGPRTILKFQLQISGCKRLKFGIIKMLSSLYLTISWQILDFHKALRYSVFLHQWTCQRYFTLQLVLLLCLDWSYKPNYSIFNFWNNWNCRHFVCNFFIFLEIFFDDIILSKLNWVEANSQSNSNNPAGILSFLNKNLFSCQNFKMVKEIEQTKFFFSEIDGNCNK